MESESVRLVLVFTQNAEKNAKAYTDAVVAALPNGLVYKGAVNYYADLDNAAKRIGYTYTVKYKGTTGTEPDGTEYAWGEYEDVAQWIALGPNISAKADKIAGGTTGDILILGDDGNPADSNKSMTDLLLARDRGAPNGVASLTEAGMVPSSQLPVSSSVGNMELRLVTEV